MAHLLQDLVDQFFNAEAASSFRKPWHRLTALPDAYNYKEREGCACSCPCLFLQRPACGMCNTLPALVRNTAPHPVPFCRRIGASLRRGGCPCSLTRWVTPAAPAGRWLQCTAVAAGDCLRTVSGLPCFTQHCCCFPHAHAGWRCGDRAHPRSQARAEPVSATCCDTTACTGCCGTLGHGSRSGCPFGSGRCVNSGCWCTGGRDASGPHAPPAQLSLTGPAQLPATVPAGASSSTCSAM